MGDCIPYFERGDAITCTATAAVTGGQLVKITGDINADGTFDAAPCGAGDVALGVAIFDAASGARFTVHTIESGHIVPITTTDALTAGASVKTGAAGAVALAVTDDNAVGFAMTGAADDAVAMILLSRHVAA